MDLYDCPIQTNESTGLDGSKASIGIDDFLGFVLALELSNFQFLNNPFRILMSKILNK